MGTNHILVWIIGAILVGTAAYVGYSTFTKPPQNTQQYATLSGTYVCLPHVDTSGPQTAECAFGLETDDDEYYAVNFGASADVMPQFISGAHMRGEGFITPKAALDTQDWQKYRMQGLFTITNILEIALPAPRTP